MKKIKSPKQRPIGSPVEPSLQDAVDDLYELSAFTPNFKQKALTLPVESGRPLVISVREFKPRGVHLMETDGRKVTSITTQLQGNKDIVVTLEYEGKTNAQFLFIVIGDFES